MSTNNKSPVNIFDDCLEVYLIIEEDLRPYYIEIVSVLAEMNLVMSQLNDLIKRLDVCITSLEWTKDKYFSKNGKTEKIPKDENLNKIYGFIRKDAPSLIISINLYVKSLSSLENKIALLQNKKETLCFPEDRLYPKNIRKATKFPKLLNFFVSEPIKRLVDNRDKIEHGINRFNVPIGFFIENKSINVHMSRQLKTIHKTIKIIDDSNKKIYENLYPELLNYLNGVGKQMRYNSTMSNKIKFVISIITPQLAGIIGSVFTASSVSTWYVGIMKPALNPPSWVFGPVWTTLFILMGISAFIIWKKGLDQKGVKVALGIFLGQLVLNTLWSIIFFGLRSPFWAFIEIIFLWLAILATIVAFYKISKVAGWLLIPYLLWVSFASYLNYSIYVLN